MESFESTFYLCSVYCPNFRNESNGIFLLGVGFFLQTNFDSFTSHFVGISLDHSKSIGLELKFEKIFHL